jgi:deazaflavin-dependent oxidoreductase (nitroreductase family)
MRPHLGSFLHPRAFADPQPGVPQWELLVDPLPPGFLASGLLHDADLERFHALWHNGRKRVLRASDGQQLRPKARQARKAPLTPVPQIAGYRPQQQKSQLEKALQALARTRPGGWLFIHVFPAIDRKLIPLTRGRLKVALGQPIVLLHTRGARSGQPRTTPLLYTPHAEGFIIVASKAGAAHHPAWYHNIRAHPDDVAVEISGRRIPVHAREVKGRERDDLWRRANDNYNGYQRYQARTGNRIIPVLLLKP